MALAAAGACTRLAGEGAGQAMRTPDEIIRFADSVMQSPPWTPERVAKVTGARLDRDAQRSNENFTVHQSAPAASGAFQRVELRVASAASGAKGNLLIVDLRGGSGVTEAQVEAKFGEPEDIEPPSPHAEASPLYLIYVRPWGKVSFGFKASGNRELVRLVLDATGQ